MDGKKDALQNNTVSVMGSESKKQEGKGRDKENAKNKKKKTESVTLLYIAGVGIGVEESVLENHPCQAVQDLHEGFPRSVHRRGQRFARGRRRLARRAARVDHFLRCGGRSGASSLAERRDGVTLRKMARREERKEGRNASD